ncbi:hypothetical protein [Demequina sp.]|uniref:hypothetical protein n=1 Tax=Demequina sp. TaxID=2050685 RepID=UPI003A861677
MWMVTPRSVGRVAYARMARDGVIRPLLPGQALPGDIEDVPAVRRAALARVLPAGTQATGLAAAWAHGVGDRPESLELRCHARRRPRQANPPLMTTCHAVGVIPADDGTDLPVAPLPVALVDALRWGPLSDAVPTVAAALDRGLVTWADLEPWRRKAVSSRSPSNIHDAWTVLVTYRAIQRDTSTQGLRAPVTRRAS